VNQVNRSSATALETAARIVTMDGHREHIGVRAATSREKAIGRITPAKPSPIGAATTTRS
jgi:hypothetical protein